MAKRSREVLADNLETMLNRFLQAGGKSRRAWALKHGLHQDTIEHALNRPRGPTVESLDDIAAGLGGGLRAWHLIYPDLDPDNLPQVPRLSAMALDLAKSFDRLPDSDEKRRLYILIVGMIELRPPLPAVAPEPAAEEAPETPPPSPPPTAVPPRRR